MLEFKNTLANSIKFSKDESIDKLNYGQMLNASKELVYNSCDILHSDELMKELECGEPFDIPVKIFGIDGTIQLAQKVNEEFEDSNAEVVIKNS